MSGEEHGWAKEVAVRQSCARRSGASKDRLTRLFFVLFPFSFPKPMFPTCTRKGAKSDRQTNSKSERSLQAYEHHP